MPPINETHRQEIIEIAERCGLSNVRVFVSMPPKAATWICSSPQSRKQP